MNRLKHFLLWWRTHFLLPHKYPGRAVNRFNLIDIVGVQILLDVVPKNTEQSALDTCRSVFICILATLSSQQSIIVCCSGSTFNCSFISSSPTEPQLD